MRITLLTQLFTFLFLSTVHATHIVKRDISPGVQVCVNDIVATTSAVDATTAAVLSFYSTAGYAGIFAIHLKFQTSISNMSTSTTDCCAITSITNEEATLVETTISQLSPAIQELCSALNSKLSNFESVTLGFSLIKPDIQTLHTKLENLSTCVGNIEFCPFCAQPFSDANYAFDQTEAIYGI